MFGDFYDWLLESYEDGDLTMREIDKAIDDPYSAHNLFIEMCSNNKYELGEMAQVDLKRFKKFIQNREENRNGN
jgi:hypothetical protein